MTCLFLILVVVGRSDTLVALHVSFVLNFSMSAAKDIVTLHSKRPHKTGTNQVDNCLLLGV